MNVDRRQFETTAVCRQPCSVDAPSPRFTHEIGTVYFIFFLNIDTEAASGGRVKTTGRYSCQSTRHILILYESILPVPVTVPYQPLTVPNKKKVEKREGT